MNPSQLICPKCGHPDQIQKVTSVYGGNTKEWRESHGSGQNRSTTFHQARTLLGEKLAPPVKPSGPLHPMLWYGIGGFILFIVLATICPVLVVVPMAVLVSTVPLLATPLVNPESIPNIPNWIPITGIICLGLVILVVLVAVAWAAFKVKQRFDRDMAHYNSQKAKVDTEDLPRWQRAMDRWNNAYYCARDETVFIPGEDKAIPADNLKDYLFDPHYHPL